MTPHECGRAASKQQGIVPTLEWLEMLMLTLAVVWEASLLGN